MLRLIRKVTFSIYKAFVIHKLQSHEFASYMSSQIILRVGIPNLTDAKEELLLDVINKTTCDYISQLKRDDK